MDSRHITMTEANADFINGINAIDDGCTGTYRNQWVHVGRTVEQRLKAHPVVFEIDEHHRNQKQELRKRKAHGIFHPQQETGEGPSHHVAHWYIKQRYGKQGRKQQPLFHLLIFCLCRTGFRILSPACGTAFVLDICSRFGKCPISGFFNSLDNPCRIQNGFIIRSNHAVL